MTPESFYEVGALVALRDAGLEKNAGWDSMMLGLSKVLGMRKARETLHLERPEWKQPPPVELVADKAKEIAEEVLPDSVLDVVPGLVPRTEAVAEPPAVAPETPLGLLPPVTSVPEVPVVQESALEVPKPKKPKKPKNPKPEAPPPEVAL